MQNPSSPVRLVALATLALALTSEASDFATTVVDYHPGSGAKLANPYAAVGRPGDIVAAGSGFAGVYSPFNSHYEAQHIAQIGEGGSLTLRLGSAVDVSSAQMDLGLFTNAALIDGDFPNGVAAGSFGEDSVTLEVSADGIGWALVGDVFCDFPASAFSDSPSPFQADPTGLTASDFGKPHSLQLADLDGETHAQILALLDGSAGGTWVDVSLLGLTTISYIRLSVADDEDAGTANTFELAAIAVNSSNAVPAPTQIDFREDFADDPLGSRASSTPGHATYSGGALTTNYDLSSSPGRTTWPLGGGLTDSDSFSYSVDFSISALEFSEDSFGQLSFGLINSTTTGTIRTSSPSDTWDILTVDYFPSESVATLTPTVIGSQQPGQTNAFENLGFPFSSASLINEPGEIGSLPLNTPLTITVTYDAPTRNLTLRLVDQAINAFGSNPDGDDTTIEYVIPGEFEFTVDTFATLCWQETSGGTATLDFTRLSVTTASPPRNYYSWADANIDPPIERDPSADANRNGLDNLLEYALLSTAPKITFTSETTSIGWQTSTTRTDVEVIAQASPDLQSWSPISAMTSEPMPGVIESSAAISPGTAKRFLRLKATRP